MDIWRSLLGMAILLLIGLAISNNRRAIRPRVVVAALLCQIAIGALVLFVPLGKDVLAAAANGVNHVLDYGHEGAAFLFGGLVDSKMFVLFGDSGFVFAFRVLSAIIFVTALVSVLYYIGLMKWFVIILGTLFHKVIGVSRLESFSAVTTIFVGQSEMPAVVKPFINRMNGAELFTVMSSGMAAVAGSVLAGYAGMGVKMEYLLAASFMAIPGGLLFAKLIHPDTEPSQVEFNEIHFDEKRPTNIIEAAASGVLVGLQIALNVGAMLIAFIALIALCNGAVGGFFSLFGHPEWNLEFLMGAAFSPLAWMIGVPWQDAQIAGNFIGQKMIINEFVAYSQLSAYLKDAGTVAASGLQALDPRTIAIVSFALCGFANFASIAILAGGFAAVAPERRSEVTQYGLRVVTAGTLSNLMSATIAGIFLSL
ncbi:MULTISPECIES: NupC/NupG family nucleoside CNT transporter [unclassified Haematospirillum]|uniref:NupC/NupG family nucleoside CNT transporter n=2 Tax=Haematospirillum TaxID=1804663 RepID=UPI00143BBFC9|nr:MULTISPECIES: NupC/NupG family nucleoside CNT transporter [unclassified Haematospirillum]NKD54037.1 NupC/NupG family nucleoside CNT transporter [Haematospirillum sp. H4890]NKD74082.1 NupC/NupG family nucleoside CNT transporter [Haematospirillum sp. H4485]NKD87248.1 NupC/NupG family nucleoside CNT transporter [Haematospirillum sp. 15-248]